MESLLGLRCFSWGGGETVCEKTISIYILFKLLNFINVNTAIVIYSIFVLSSNLNASLLNVHLFICLLVINTFTCIAFIQQVSHTILL